MITTDGAFVQYMYMALSPF